MIAAFSDYGLIHGVEDIVLDGEPEAGPVTLCRVFSDPMTYLGREFGYFVADADPDSPVCPVCAGALARLSKRQEVAR